MFFRMPEILYLTPYYIIPLFQENVIVDDYYSGRIWRLRVIKCRWFVFICRRRRRRRRQLENLTFILNKVFYYF